MLADKMRHVLDTGAEVCTAGDSSCLMHIGGGLSRIRAATRTVHLAQILASTRAEPMPLTSRVTGRQRRESSRGPREVARIDLGDQTPEVVA